MDELFLMAGLLIGLGVFSGFLAGLLGVGGGIVLVPGLYSVFTLAGFPDEILMHMAVATSLSVIVFTGISSARAHYARDSVDIRLAIRVAVGVVAGAASAAIVAPMIDGGVLRQFFAVLLAIMSAVMFFDLFSRFQPSGRADYQAYVARYVVAGLVIGFLSALAGIGGATLCVPYLVFCGVAMHRAVGTTSAIGVVIGLVGSVSYILVGQGAVDGVPYTAGYVSWLAVLLLAPLTFAVAPIGARYSHRLPVKRLRQIFAFFMIVVAIKMGVF